LYLVLVFIFLYWLIALTVSPYFFLFWHPPFIQSLKTNLFLFVIHSLLLLASAASAPIKSPRSVGRSVVACSYLQKCVRIMKICKQCKHIHMKNATTTMNDSYLFLCSLLPLQLSPKKNNFFLSTSHSVYPFQKSVV